MTARGRITKWRVTSHGLRFGSGDLDEEWFHSSEAAEVEAKTRLGLQRLNKTARETRWESAPDGPTSEHEGFTWRCAHRREYSQVPQSSGVQDSYGFIHIDEMQRPSPPFENPFKD